MRKSQAPVVRSQTSQSQATVRSTEAQDVNSQRSSTSLLSEIPVNLSQPSIATKRTAPPLVAAPSSQPNKIQPPDSMPSNTEPAPPQSKPVGPTKPKKKKASDNASSGAAGAKKSKAEPTADLAPGADDAPADDTQPSRKNKHKSVADPDAAAAESASSRKKKTKFAAEQAPELVTAVEESGPVQQQPAGKKKTDDPPSSVTPARPPRPARPAPPSINDGDDASTQTQSANDIFRHELSLAGLSAPPERFSCPSLQSLTTHLRTLHGNKAVGFNLGLDAFLADPASLHHALLPLKVEDSPALQNPSLIRVLLGIRPLQTRLLKSLLELFLSASLADDSSSDETPKRILFAIKMLDYVWESRALADQVFDCMRALNDTNSPWLKELILALPEILSDAGDHARTVEHLVQMLKERADMAAPVIDALTNLSIPATLYCELIDTVLGILERAPVDVIPVAVNFLLRASEDNADGSKLADKVIKRLSFLHSADSDSEALVLKELHHGLLLKPAIASSYLAELKRTKQPLNVADFWLLVALRSSPVHIQAANTALKRFIKNEDAGELLRKAVMHHRAALEQHFLALVDLASNLVCSNGIVGSAHAFRSFGATLYQLVFDEFADARCRQEVALALAMHCGAGPACKDEVDAGLRCFRGMVRTHQGAVDLAPFSSYIRALLVDLERFDKYQGRLLFRVVGRLAQVDGDGFDEVKILLRKLLTSPEPVRQLMGVVGTIQTAAVLSPSSQSSPYVDSQQGSDYDSTSERLVVNLAEAMDLVDCMVRETRSASWQVQAFMYDEIAAACEAHALHGTLQKEFGDNVAKAVEARLLESPSTGHDALFGSALVPVELFGTDSKAVNSAVVQILPLLNDALLSTRARDSLNIMCPLVRCLVATAGTEDSDAVLGCGLSMPSPAVLDGLATRPALVREAVCSAFFFSSNWLREVIGAFAGATVDPFLQTKLCDRLSTLVQNESLLDRAVAANPSYKPPTAEDAAAKKPAASKSASKPPQKPKKTALTADEPVAEDPDEDGEAPEETAKRSTSRSTRPSLDVAAAQQAVRASLRELSPSLLRLFGFPDLSLRLSCDEPEELERKQPCALTVEALKVAVESMTRQVAQRLGKRAKGSADTPRVFELELFDFVGLVVETCLPPCRAFADMLVSRMTDEHETKLSPGEQKDAVAILEGLASTVASILRADALKHSHKGKALLLQGLRAFATEPRKRTLADGLSFSVDLPVRTDSSGLLCEALNGAMEFFNSRFCQSGALSTSLDASMTVFGLLQDLVNTHKSLSAAAAAAAAGGGGEGEVTLVGGVLDKALGKLAKQMLRTHWKAPAGLAQPKYGKANIAVLVGVTHEWSEDPLESALEMLAEIEMRVGQPADAPRVAHGKLKFPALENKTVTLFYGPSFTCLTAAVANMRKKGPGFVLDMKRAAESFSKAVLLTQRLEKPVLLREAVKLGKAFLDVFLKKCAPELASRADSELDSVAGIFRALQSGTRQLQTLCVYGKDKKDQAIMANTPVLRKLLETLVVTVKSIYADELASGFEVGQLRARNLDGTKVKAVAAPPVGE